MESQGLGSWRPESGNAWLSWGPESHWVFLVGISPASISPGRTEAGAWGKKNEGESCLRLYAKHAEKLTKTSSFCVKIPNLGVLEVLWEGGNWGQKSRTAADQLCRFESWFKKWGEVGHTNPNWASIWPWHLAAGNLSRSSHMHTKRYKSQSVSAPFPVPACVRSACSSYVCNRQVSLACFTVLFSNPDSSSARKDFRSSISSTTIFGGQGEKSSLGCKTHLPSRSQSPNALGSNCGVTKAVLEFNQQASSSLYKAPDLCKYDLICKVYRSVLHSQGQWSCCDPPCSKSAESAKLTLGTQVVKVVLTQHSQIYALGPSSSAPPPHLPWGPTALLRAPLS